MVNVNYELNVSPSVAESYLANTEYEGAQFFIKKEEGLVSLDISLSDDLDFSSEIYSVSKTATKYKVLSNTTDILATNIKINNVDYYYKIEAIGAAVDYKTVILNSAIECVSYQGNIYTNEVIINEELEPGLFLHSVPVIDTLANGSIKYRAKDIEISFPAKLGDLTFKCKSDLVITPLLINDSKVYIPSFYLKKDSSIFKCIEGDIKIVAKQELAYFVGNSISCKDYISEYDAYFFNRNSNKIYLDFYNYKTTPALIAYKAKLSSHIFSFNNEDLYFKLKPTGLVKADKSDYDFSIKKVFDVTKLSVIESKYLTTYKHSLNPNDYVLVDEPIADLSEAVSLKYHHPHTSFTKYPSQVAYLEYRNRYILQHNNDILPSDTNDLVEEDTYTDTYYTFKDHPKIYDDYRFVKINGTYYYKNSDNYYTVFLYEDDGYIQLEDALNFLMEF